MKCNKDRDIFFLLSAQFDIVDWGQRDQLTKRIAIIM